MRKTRVNKFLLPLRIHFKELKEMNSMDINGPQSALLWLRSLPGSGKKPWSILLEDLQKFLKGNKYKNKNEQILKVFICTH